jgi:hypothetical protein
MYAVVRTCAGPGDNELFDLLDRRKAEIEAVMANSPGTSKLHAGSNRGRPSSGESAKIARW